MKRLAPLLVLMLLVAVACAQISLGSGSWGTMTSGAVPGAATVYLPLVDFAGGTIPSTLQKHCAPDCTTSTVVVSSVFDATNWAVSTVPTNGSAAALWVALDSMNLPSSPPNPATSTGTGLCFSYDWVMHTDPALITGGGTQAQIKVNYDRDIFGTANLSWTMFGFGAPFQASPNNGKLTAIEDDGVDGAQCGGACSGIDSTVTVAQDTKYHFTFWFNYIVAQTGGQEKIWINPTGGSPAPNIDTFVTWGAYLHHMGNATVDGSMKQYMTAGIPYLQNATGTVTTYTKNLYASSAVDLTTGLCK
jgi:hypothetical protein